MFPFILIVAAVLTFTKNTHAGPPTEAYFCINHGYHKSRSGHRGLHIEKHPVTFSGEFAHTSLDQMQPDDVYLFYGKYHRPQYQNNKQGSATAVGLLKQRNGFLADTAALRKATAVPRIEAALPTEGRLYVAPLFQDAELIKIGDPRRTPYTLGQGFLGRGTEVYGLTATFSEGRYLIRQGSNDAYLNIEPLSNNVRRLVNGIPEPFHLPLEIIDELEPGIKHTFQFLAPYVQAYKRQKLQKLKDEEEEFVNSFFIQDPL